jgi:hypothetical protein
MAEWCSTVVERVGLEARLCSLVVERMLASTVVERVAVGIARASRKRRQRQGVSIVGSARLGDNGEGIGGGVGEAVRKGT